MGGKKVEMTSVQPLMKFVLVTARRVLAGSVNHCWGINFLITYVRVWQLLEN